MILGKVILRKWNTFAQCDFENMLNYFFTTISFFYLIVYITLIICN